MDQLKPLRTVRGDKVHIALLSPKKNVIVDIRAFPLHGPTSAINDWIRNKERQLAF